MFSIILKTGELVCDNIPSKLLAYRLGRCKGDCYVIKDGGIIYDLNEEDRDKLNMVNLLLEGFSFDYKKISICTIQRRTGDKYQVTMITPKKEISELYKTPEMAVNRFFELKKSIRK